MKRVVREIFSYFSSGSRKCLETTAVGAVGEPQVGIVQKYDIREQQELCEVHEL